MQLVYETHAITTDNEAGSATGWLPGRLSERGRETAAELGARRRDDGLAAIHVSDLERALETVRIAFAGSPIPVVVDERLRECNYGRLNGMPRARRRAAGGRARRRSRDRAPTGGPEASPSRCRPRCRW